LALLVIDAGDRKGLQLAARRITEGEIVALPTDTVYGLACDGFNQNAVARIYQIKRRSEKKPLVLFVSDVSQARLFAEVSDLAQKLMRQFWPGPLTLVCRASDTVPPWLRSGETVALRIPDHPIPLELVKTTKTPLATTSANLSGQPPATSAPQVVAALSDEIALVIDAGPSPLAHPSTILDATGPYPRILRQGALAKEIQEAIADLWSKSGDY